MRWWRIRVRPHTLSDYAFPATPQLRWCDEHGDAIHVYRKDESRWLCRKCMLLRMQEERKGWG